MKHYKFLLILTLLFISNIALGQTERTASLGELEKLGTIPLGQYNSFLQNKSTSERVNFLSGNDYNYFSIEAKKGILIRIETHKIVLDANTYRTENKKKHIYEIDESTIKFAASGTSTYRFYATDKETGRKYRVLIFTNERRIIFIHSDDNEVYEGVMNFYS